ncbi:MAG: Holliday junction DNA helicase RuvA, holliday junction DNA helicase RuvA [Microgenomates group bacterium GW2011_GWC1_44_37]|uniref:Holliday junction branch migration complex subunit RuvA n=1 Tax=Candidatus Collierbacteria bacterium GW2011_GWB2_44_22 TaxID=1618387 RepID=A0A0G1HX21_9BACT|nr:MAG: Holliday junction ATP-dependent DNA helicase RuvA [Candidatus Collierbacteria bacterium GW2011_GWA2_44_13]KKT51030.1 MAG: Holliday junction ATP-dependent DNA helicase RuvA [Candidatus Collierbacteria bacterium GW2011_GWB1_44_197]KKT51490.1 MAG: Holliday junction ATP-dependent DNA helicase RuvA [Candidatus Collierbacteria bacterium GW2011_GWB2_44_22]KKT62227.1 MAG: Holliday junction ATP-dependent DNA helicase RuvA [Candidatus Collierbacteria bacterium GW2011_GWD1_44_27]KKT66768.1 MAG: Ho
MIGYLEGEIKYAGNGKIILFANGIGFTIFIPGNLVFLEKNQAKLFIHTHLREDSLSLFGFSSSEDLDLFELLISVSGVGPKIGLAIFTAADSTNIIRAIESTNLSFFTSISGVGKKTAQKIILDLKSKVGKGDINMKNLEGSSELVDSLISLGFQKQEIAPIMVEIDNSLPLSMQIKNALKLLRK